MTEIEQYGSIELFEEVPDYAIDALWLEWQRKRKSKPPASIICTTGKSYQAFCKILSECGSAFDATKFPSAFVTRQTAGKEMWQPQRVDRMLQLEEEIFGYIPQGASYKPVKQEDVYGVGSTSEWPEEDSGVYVAFVYEGHDRRSLQQAILESLRLTGKLHLLAGGK